MAFYGVSPVRAPAGYVPFLATSSERAEYLKSYLEQEYRNRFTMTLDWDEADPGKHISVSFSYPPSYLFDFQVTPA